MKMNRKSILSVMMALLLLNAVSCGADETKQANNNETETAVASAIVTETEDTDVYDALPADLSFNGEEFHILAPEEYDGQSMAVELDGEVLNDAQYRVQQTVSDRLNVQMKETLTGFWDMEKEVVNLVMSGDSTYDCITMMDRYALSAAQKGIFIPLQDVSYIDLSREYWGGNLSEALTIANQGLFAVSSFNIHSFANTCCTLINTRLASQYDLEIPYASVDDGTWTMDKMLSMTKGVTQDVNGDSVMDRSDIYGIGTYDRRAVPAIVWISAGEKTVDKDSNDIPFNATDGNERLYAVLDKVHSTFYYGEDTLSFAYDKDEYEPDKYSTFPIFKEGRQLIFLCRFSSIVELRDMEDDYSVLPIPKYDEQTDTYYSRTFDSMFTMIPVTADNTELAGAVLEAWSCAAYNDVLPAYIETTLQDKCTRDPESVRMINIAFNSRVIDIGEAYLFDYFGDNAMYSILCKSTADIASAFEKNKKGVEKKLNSIVEMFSE